MISILLLATPAVLFTGSDVTADQIDRLLPAAAASIRDLTFVYEGESAYLGKPDIKGRTPESYRLAYQGTYTFRSDGATFLDSYTRKGTLPELYHNRVVVLDRKLESYTVRPDAGLRPGPLPIQRSSGNPGNLSLHLPWSPLHFNHLWFLNGPSYRKFFQAEVKGWESIDGNRCLRVEFRQEFPDGAHVIRYWFDMARGGNPLKVEHLHGSTLSRRLDRVVLRRFETADGPGVWIPISGVVENFGWENNYYDFAVFREDYAVVVNSVQINRGPGDGEFKIDRVLNPSDPGLQATVRAFDTTPMLRSDPAGVRSRLVKQLDEAERQSKMLDASAEARASFSTIGFWRTTLAATGGILLASAGLLFVRGLRRP